MGAERTIKNQGMEMNNKSVFLLIGQKGGGKSFIGNLFEKNFGIKFIRVEDWAKRIKKERAVDNEEYLMQVFDEIEKGIRETLLSADKIVFESTGLTKYFDQMLYSLRQDYKVTTIEIYADSNICLERVKTRDQNIHINVSDEQVLMINEMVRGRSFKSDFSIMNENKSETELIIEISSIIQTVEKLR